MIADATVCKIIEEALPTTLCIIISGSITIMALLVIITKLKRISSLNRNSGLLAFGFTALHAILLGIIVGIIVGFILGLSYYIIYIALYISS